jgi:microcompartment protein CcmK/EutM
MAEGTTAIDTALSTEGDADGTDLIEFTPGTFVHAGDDPEGPLEYIRDHEEISARKLAPPFWGKPFVAWVLLAFMREIQAVEDTFWDILESRTLENADLTRLKVLGKLVGQPRHGFDLEDYRTLIAARAIANVSQGRASDLLAALNIILGAGDYVLVAIGNATLFLSALNPIDATGFAMVEEILPDTRAAGVGLQFLYSSSADVFVWGDPWGSPEEWGTVRTL